MGESLIERRRVQEEGLRPVNCFSSGTSPALFGFLILTLFWFVIPAKTGIKILFNLN